MATTTLREQLYAAESGDPLLILVTIEHDDLARTYRFVDDVAEIASGSDTYRPKPMQVTLPDERDRVPSGRLIVDSVDPAFGADLLSIDSPATVRVRLVLASDPDTVEEDYGDMELSDVVVTRTSVRARISLPDLAREPFPTGSFTPSHFPDIF